MESGVIEVVAPLLIYNAVGYGGCLVLRLKICRYPWVLNQTLNFLSTIGREINVGGEDSRKGCPYNVKVMFTINLTFCA